MTSDQLIVLLNIYRGSSLDFEAKRGNFLDDLRRLVQLGLIEQRPPDLPLITAKGTAYVKQVLR